MESFLEKTGLVDDILEYANIYEKVISKEDAIKIAKTVVEELIYLHSDEITVSSAVHKFENNKKLTNA